MPVIVSKAVKTTQYAQDILANAIECYSWLIEDGTPKEEARQVLPNAAEVRLIWTVNARSLFNFFEQRWCSRNVEEMRWFCTVLHNVVGKTWPEFASFLGPYCYQRDGKCNQGKMTCGRPWVYDD